MKITRTSIFTKITRTVELPITEQQLAAWQTGTLIQDAFPHLTPDQREFLLSGATSEEWDQLFGEEE